MVALSTQCAWLTLLYHACGGRWWLYGCARPPQGDLLVERIMAKALLDAPEQAVQLLQDAERRGDLR